MHRVVVSGGETGPSLRSGMTAIGNIKQIPRFTPPLAAVILNAAKDLTIKTRTCTSGSYLRKHHQYASRVASTSFPAVPA